MADIVSEEVQMTIGSNCLHKVCEYNIKIKETLK